MTGGGIFRARLRPDGFVSVDAGALTTKLLQLKGDHLLINSSGSVSVSVLGEGGRTLATGRVSGDSIEHEVLFDGKSIGQIIQGNLARLRFEVGPESCLYSFQVR